MRIYNKRSLSLFSTFLAGLILLVVIGTHNFPSKKFLAFEGDNIESPIDYDAESDNDLDLSFDHALAPGYYSNPSKAVKLNSPKPYHPVHAGKQFSEQRLYILFQQLKLHIA